MAKKVDMDISDTTPLMLMKSKKLKKHEQEVQMKSRAYYKTNGNDKP